MKAANNTNIECNDVIKDLNISMTFKEIAQEMGISEQEVKEIYQSAMKKIKNPRIGKKLKEYVQM
jgi:DNA-directed RNA polymerase sigma subunit (sigma70/sigma32)